MSRSRIRRTALAVILLGLALAPASRATKGGPINYPKVATYVYQVGQFTEAQRETLSWNDLVTCRERPEVIADMRARNPHQIILHRSMPQNIESGGEGQTYWYPDTAWCLMSLCKFYATQNDWYLYDTSGERIEEWGGYAANWTRYCPRGTYGTSRGMTYAEWYINVALPQIAYHASAWERWGYGSSSYDGIAWETFFDCPACCIAGQYRYADPDRDGSAEGIEGTCWDGGYEDSLSILYRETNVTFRQDMLRTLEPDMIVNINRGGYQLNPEWAWELNGLKLEDWRPSRTNPIKSWWSWMYGRRSSYSFVGDGYQFAERYMHPTGIDERDGWDMSWLMVWTRGEDWTPSFRSRMQRWGLGTTMLGDGYFIFTEDQKHPTWLPSFDWDFGEPLEDYQRELHDADTLYVRRFARGFVEVNPYDHVVNSLNAEDARFAFWLPLTDLSVEAVGTDQVTLTWVVPAGWEYTFDRTEVRYAAAPIAAETWDAATPAPAGLVSGAPGERIDYAVTGLEPDTDYWFAARNTIYWRPEPGISNVVTTTTGASQGEDVTPPAAITDLASTDSGSSWARIAWSATGDDGREGTADRYLVRRQTGRAISSESDWAQAVPVSGTIPTPGPPGTAQSMRVEGLSAGTTYGLAVRVVDDADLVSGLSNPLVVTTLSPGDGTPPAPIRNLAADSVHVDGFTLGWTATGDDGTQGRASRYVFGYLQGVMITTEGAWTVAEKVAGGLPVPATSGAPETYRLRGLEPGRTYGLALRAYDDAGHLSALGNSPLLTTEPLVLPDTIPPAPITEITALGAGSRSVELRWACTGDDSLAGRAARFVLGYLEGTELSDETDWERAQKVDEGLPEPENAGQNVVYTLSGLTPEQTYAIAVRAYDDAELLSAPGGVVVATTPALPDTLPPDGVSDLRSPEQGAGWIELAWSATGDDGATGRADHYELRYLTGRAIDDESDWSAAQPAEGELPVPGEPGAAERARLTGLGASTSYGVALRAFDEAGHRAPLSNPLLVKTADLPDQTPPAAVGDMEIEGSYVDGFDLGWVAPGDDGTQGTATLYVLAYREGIAIDSEARWASAVRETLETLPPAIAGSRQRYRVMGLQPETTYGLAVRAVDDVGLIGPLPMPLIGTTSAPSAPPDTTPPGPIDDLALVSAAPTSLRVGWSAPGDDGLAGRADHFEIAWTANADPIDTEEDWGAAERRSDGLPAPPEPGAAVEYRLEGLTAGTAYAIAVRAFDEVGRAGGLSNALLAATTPAPDDTPPAAIPDLAASAVGETWVALTWSSTGDDEWIGKADHFILGWSGLEALTSETAWGRAQKVTGGLPEPGEPSTVVAYTLSGLVAGHAYSVAVRAVDDAGWTSPLGPAAAFTTIEATDGVPPGRVSDLAVDLVGPDAVRLSWTAAGDDGSDGTAPRLLVARRGDQTITTEEEWEASQLDTLENLTPGGAPDTLRREGLEPGRSWGFALRYCDETGAAGEISNFAAAFVPAAPVEIDSIPPGPVVNLYVAAMEQAALTICWTPSGDDSTAGEAAGYVVGVLPGARIDAANWEQAAIEPVDATLGERVPQECHGVTGLAVGESYGLAVRAIDEEGNLSEIGDRLWVPRNVPGPVTPPEVVTDLRVAATGADWVDLAWSAPEGGGSTAEAYEIVWDEMPPSDEDWSASYHWRPVHAPGAANTAESLRLASLGGDRTYWIALRTRNGLGRWSDYSTPLQARTVPRDADAPAAPEAPTVAIDADAWIAHVSWPAAAEADVVGYHVYGRSAGATERECLTGTPVADTHWSFAVSAGGENLYVSVAAVDASGNIGAPGAETSLFEEKPRLAGPFPHPIEEEARFELTLPPRAEGYARVTGRIFTVAGAPVRRWIDEDLPTGPEHELHWDTRSDDGERVAPGLYFLRIDVAGQTLIRKIYVGR
jgi:hypothetical protein